MYQDGGAATVNGWLRLGINSGASSSYTLAGGTLNINGANVPSGNALEANIGENGAGTLTIGGSGGGAMIVSPTGVLTVANGAGSGVLNLKPNGLLRTPDIAAGSGAATFNFSGGTLQNALSSGLTVAMPVNLSGQGTVAVDSGQTATFQSNAPIGGSGGLTKTGGGTMIVQSNNTYAGPTIVSGGTLQLGDRAANGSIDDTSALSIAARAVVNYDLATSDTASYPIIGVGSLSVTGGTLTLSGSNTYTGGTFMEGDGTLVLTNRGALEDGSNLYVGTAVSAFAPIAPQSQAALAAARAAVAPVPEPGTLLLLIAGASLLAMYNDF